MAEALRISSARIYEIGATKDHHVISFCEERISEVNEQIDALRAEKRMLKLIVKRFRAGVCGNCDGEGSVMGYLPGDTAADGRRMMTCKTCKGSGRR